MASKADLQEKFRDAMREFNFTNYVTTSVQEVGLVPNETRVHHVVHDLREITGIIAGVKHRPTSKFIQAVINNHFRSIYRHCHPSTTPYMFIYGKFMTQHVPPELWKRRYTTNKAQKE